MPDQTRLHCPGGTLFFTVALAPGAAFSLLDKLHLLRIAYSEVLSENPFRTDAIVILPDHLHAVWTLPEGDSAYSLRWRKIKGRFTRMVKHSGPIRSGTHEVWAQRFKERALSGKTLIRNHLEYCWADPVRHGFVEHARDWTASSIHREIRAGKLPADWAPRPPQKTAEADPSQPDLLSALSA